MMPRTLFSLTAAAALAAHAQAGDWLQFRGPGGTGVAADTTLPTQLDAKNIVAKIALPGRGLSSPVIVGDRVFVTACSGLGQERLHVIAFSAKDGAKLWERQFWATGRTMAHEKISVASNSPCSDGQRLFALFSSNDLVCLDLDGNLQWFRGIGRDYPNASNSLGMAASPLVVGGTLVVPVENDSESFALGLDVKTGANRWKRERPKMASWASPVVVQDAGSGKPLVALQGGKGLSVVDPLTGEEAWYYPDGAATMASSVLADGVLFVPSRGIAAMKPVKGGGQPDIVWQNPQLTPGAASPIVLGGRIFTVNGAGVLTCASITDGKRLWQLRTAGPYSATPVAAGKHLYLVNEKGLVQVVDPDAPEGAIVSKLDLADTVIGTPSIGAGALFVRTDAAIYKIGAK